MADDAYSCSVCFEEYNEDKHCPRILLCGHTLCTECLWRMLDLGTITCPHDRETTQAPFGPTSLRKNFALIDVIKASAASVSRQRAQPKVNSDQDCATHCLKFQYYDKDCRAMLCSDCVAYTHRGHEVCSLNDEVEKRRKSLKDLVEEVTSKNEAFKTAINHCNTVLGDIEKEQDEKMTYLQTAFDQISLILAARKEALANEMRRQFEHKIVSLSEQKRYFSDASTKASQNLQIALSMLDHSEFVDDTMLQKLITVTEDLHSLVLVDTTVADPKNNSVSLTVNVDQLIPAIDQLGSVCVSSLVNDRLLPELTEEECQMPTTANDRVIAELTQEERQVPTISLNWDPSTFVRAELIKPKVIKGLAVMRDASAFSLPLIPHAGCNIQEFTVEFNCLNGNCIVGICPADIVEEATAMNRKFISFTTKSVGFFSSRKQQLVKGCLDFSSSNCSLGGRSARFRGHVRIFVKMNGHEDTAKFWE